MLMAAFIYDGFRIPYKMSEKKIRLGWFGPTNELFQEVLADEKTRIVEHFEDPLAGDWESVLANDEVDVVVFAITQSTEPNQNILRILIQNQIPVAIPTPDADSLFAYELEMVRVDAGGRLSAVLPLACQEVFENTTLQAQVRMDGTEMKDIYNYLTYDLLYLQHSLGAVHYVFAMGSRVNDDLRNLTVNVEFESGCVLNWGAGTPKNDSSFRQNQHQIDFSRSLVGQDRFMKTLGLLADTDDTDGTWVRYAKTREAAEMISLSLKKGRRIEIFDGNPTEGDAFKGVMSTAGCFILLLALFTITALAVLDIGQISETRDVHITALESGNSRVSPRWPLWLRLWPVYPLCLFLSFQFLKFVIRTERQPGARSKDG